MMIILDVHVTVVDCHTLLHGPYHDWYTFQATVEARTTSKDYMCLKPSG
jgi:hypothetical protein